MKKTLVALATLAATASFAQSSVTLSGGFGFGYQKNPLNQKGLALTDFEIKVSGVEDLGGGLRANFSAALTDNGNARAGSSSPTLTVPAAGTVIANPAAQAAGNYRSGLARDSFSLGLSGGFGSLALMNTRSAEFAARAFVAPSSLPDGIYDGNVLGRVAIDALVYTTPNANGFFGTLGYSEAQSDGGLVTPNLKTLSASINYANGPLAAGFVVRNTQIAVGALPRKTNSEGFVTYDLGSAMLGFGFDTKRTSVLTDKNAYTFGISFPMGAFTTGLNYGVRGNTVKGAPTDKITEFVANYAFSKRTSLMFSAGQQTGAPGVTNGSNAAQTAFFPAGGLLPAGTTKEGSQYRMKLQHNF